MRAILIFPIEFTIVLQFFDPHQRNKLLSVNLLQVVRVKHVWFDESFDWLFLSLLLHLDKLLVILLGENSVNTFGVVLYSILSPIIEHHKFWEVKRHIVISETPTNCKYPRQRLLNNSLSHSNFGDCIKKPLSFEFFLNPFQRFFEHTQQNVHSWLRNKAFT